MLSTTQSIFLFQTNSSYVRVTDIQFDLWCLASFHATNVSNYLNILSW